jgi:hypothetical protein
MGQGSSKSLQLLNRSKSKRQRFITMFKKPHHLIIGWTNRIYSTGSHAISLTFISILSSQSMWSLPIWNYKNNCIYIFHVLHGGYTICLLSCSQWHINLIKLTLSVIMHHAINTYVGVEAYAPCILNLRTTWRSVVSFMPWSFYVHVKRDSTHWLGGWVGSRGSLDGVDKRQISLPAGDQSLNPW